MKGLWCEELYLVGDGGSIWVGLDAMPAEMVGALLLLGTTLTVGDTSMKVGEAFTLVGDAFTPLGAMLIRVGSTVMSSGCTCTPTASNWSSLGLTCTTDRAASASDPT